MKDVVQSVDRALTILDVLSDFEDGLGITEISGKINLHKSTVYRLLSTLIYKGYVEQDEATNKYRLTLKLFELGNKRMEKSDILIVARSYLKELVEKTNEVVHLVILEGNEIVYIDKVECDKTIRMYSRIGKRSPVYCTGVGKAILAYLPEEKIDKIWEQSVINKHTENTITDLKEMKEHLQQIREKKYAIDAQEHEMGVTCVGAPIFNYKGEVFAAISVSGPSTRIEEDNIDELAKLIIEYSEKISRELGYKA